MLIQNGTIVAESGVFTGSLRIGGETIAALGTELAVLPGEEILDATGLIVMPGGVDVHTHMDLNLGSVNSTDDFYTGTVAAACGGTTTIVDHMAFGPRGCSIRHQLEQYHLLAKDKAVIDYGFHGVLDHVDGGILEEIGELIEDGITSHKFYLTYGGKISDGEAFALMRRAKELGVMLAVHPENDSVVNFLRAEFRAAGKTAPIYHALSRPPHCEAEAIGRMALLAYMAGGAPLYIVHLSVGLGLDIIEDARRRGQKNLFAETCPQYLLLDEERYNDPDGLKYIMCPPLRPRENNERLWRGLRDGSIQTVGTDHCPFFYAKEKQLGKDDFTLAPGGAPGVEARMPLMFSEGVQKGRLTLARMAELCCANPSKLFGLYPRKGVIAAGSDADLAIFDPGKQLTLTKQILHENTDYTPYEGLGINGWPVTTIARGKIVCQNGEFRGKKGRGRYLRRGLPMLEL